MVFCFLFFFFFFKASVQVYLLSSLNFIMAGNSSEQSARTSHTSVGKTWDQGKGRRNKTFFFFLYQSKKQSGDERVWWTLICGGRGTEIGERMEWPQPRMSGVLWVRNIWPVMGPTAHCRGRHRKREQAYWYYSSLEPVSMLQRPRLKVKLIKDVGWILSPSWKLQSR